MFSIENIGNIWKIFDIENSLWKSDFQWGCKAMQALDDTYNC